MIALVVAIGFFVDWMSRLDIDVTIVFVEILETMNAKMF